VEAAYLEEVIMSGISRTIAANSTGGMFFEAAMAKAGNSHRRQFIHKDSKTRPQKQKRACKPAPTANLPRTIKAAKEKVRVRKQKKLHQKELRDLVKERKANKRRKGGRRLHFQR